MCSFLKIFGGRLLLGIFLLACSEITLGQTLCARVKIEIKQQLTLERQAFDAEMSIVNTLDTDALENVEISVKVTDELGNSVPLTMDPNDTSAKFFLRVSTKENIGDISGGGTVAPKTTAKIGWLLIPSPGAAGDAVLGKRYLIGATLRYKFGGESQVMEVSPDQVTVRPLPKLVMDYFLTRDVIGDDPLTPAVEPTIPFTLGVRVKNSGVAAAKNLKIESAQPKIVENLRGLLINFRLTGSYVNDAPVANTLLASFGDIAGGAAKMGRWVMESSLAGRFTEFSASFSHADELGGAVTSILQGVNTHFLIHDVRVDLPGRDLVRDFLAKDGDVIRVYESDGTDSEVVDRSGQATLIASTSSDGSSHYRLSAPGTPGFMYVRLPDPYKGAKALATVMRSDAKAMSSDNVWLSRTQNPDTKQWDFWINVFDANSTGVYDTAFATPPNVPQPPVLQYITDKTVRELEQVSFIVEGSSPGGTSVSLAGAPLPLGAKFIDQGKGVAIFDWTPTVGQAGSYRITYTVSDGSLTASRTAVIQVDTAAPPPGPATPIPQTPLPGAAIANVRPGFTVQSGSDSRDPTTAVQFEIYADEAMGRLVQSGNAAKGGLVTTWTPSQSLNDNTSYWWRARATDGQGTFSAWTGGKLFINLFNDPPEPFSLDQPTAGGTVATVTPTLSLANTWDKEGDAITYSFFLWHNAALTEAVASATGVAPGEGGLTTWAVPTSLTNHGRYYWYAVATDSHGAQTQTAARYFTVYTGNSAPTTPTLVSPALGERLAANSATLMVNNATDTDNDGLAYTFELDTAASFDSPNLRRINALAQGAGGTTQWTVTGLTENTRYQWRAKANDGRSDSPWVSGNFLVDAQNEAPPLPAIANPGNKSWVATLQPTLQLNAVSDPEGDTVSYAFEVYRDAAGTQKVLAGSSDSPTWQVSSPLADKTSYYWRARAQDNLGAASSWTPLTTLYVSSQPYVNPSIALTLPAAITNGKSGSVTVQWAGVDANIDPTIALYYDRSGSGYAGTLIADGLKQSAGSQQGSYVWDLSGLAPGAYYIYGVIYDAKGVNKAYAPAPVVVPTKPQAGSIIVSPTSGISTTEDGGVGVFGVKLSKAPTQDVTLTFTTSDSMRSTVFTSGLIFNSSNWNVIQNVQIAGKRDCVSDGNHAYLVSINEAITLDPDYVGLRGSDVNMISVDSTQQSQTTDDPNIVTCGYGAVQRNPVVGGGYDYVFRLNLANLGAPIANAQLQLVAVPSGLTIRNGSVTYGAVGTGMTSASLTTFTIRSTKLLTLPLSGAGFVWKVTSKQ